MLRQFLASIRYIETYMDIEYRGGAVKGRPPSRYSFPCMFLYHLLDDVQKGPKHVVDENLMRSVVLKLVFELTINTDII
jgi:hypothetical protein